MFYSSTWQKSEIGITEPKSRYRQGSLIPSAGSQRKSGLCFLQLLVVLFMFIVHVACCISLYFEAIISNYWRTGSNWRRYSYLPTASLMKYSLFPLWMLLVLTWMSYSIKNFYKFLSSRSHQRKHQLQKILVSRVPNNSSPINKFVSSSPRCISGKWWKFKSLSHRNTDASMRLYLWRMGSSRNPLSLSSLIPGHICVWIHRLEVSHWSSKCFLNIHNILLWLLYF